MLRGQPWRRPRLSMPTVDLPPLAAPALPLPPLPTRGRLHSVAPLSYRQRIDDGLCYSSAWSTPMPSHRTNAIDQRAACVTSTAMRFLSRAPPSMPHTYAVAPFHYKAIEPLGPMEAHALPSLRRQTVRLPSVSDAPRVHGQRLPSLVNHSSLSSVYSDPTLSSSASSTRTEASPQQAQACAPLFGHHGDVPHYRAQMESSTRSEGEVVSSVRAHALTGFAATSTGTSSESLETLRTKTKRKPRMCTTDGCDKLIVDRGVCIRHGGGRRCNVDDCTRRAQHKGLCWKHGGYTICQVDGCGKRAKSHGLCWSHGGGTQCHTDGCEKVAVSRGRCWAHGGGKRCKIAECQKPAALRVDDFCAEHCARHRSAGRPLPAWHSEESHENSGR